MSPDNFSESMMQAMAEQLAQKVLAGIQQSFDLQPIKDDLRNTERLANIAICLSLLDTFAVVAIVAFAAIGLS